MRKKKIIPKQQEEKKPVTLTPVRLRILEFIYDHPRALTGEMLAGLFEGDESKASLLYYHLNKLKQGKFIKSRPTDRAWGRSSHQYYYPLKKASDILGREHKSTSIRDFSNISHTRILVRAELNDICDTNQWLLFDTDEYSKQALIKYYQMHKINRLEDLAGIKFMPDMVIFTGAESVVLSVAFIQSGASAFKTKLAKYQHILSNVKLVYITLTEYQKEECLRMMRYLLAASNLKATINRARGIYILSAGEIDKLENLLE